jgi:NADH dehydrogenase
MKKIIIIGGGFSGLTVLKKLAHHGPGCEVLLIDQKSKFDFLPILPDLISGRIDARYASNDLEPFCRRCNAQFRQGRVTSVDFDKKEVHLEGSSYPYDYLVVASGTQTAYYGNESARQQAYSLDSVEDALKIREELKTNPRPNYVVVGGGYTGIELATNIWRFFHNQGESKNIMIVEKAPKFLGFLAPRLKLYLEDNLYKLGIKVFVDSTVTQVTDQEITLEHGRKVKDAMLLWTAGVQTCDFVQAFPYPQDGKKRLKVNEYLQVNPDCFVLGDTACYEYKGQPLRMAVQFTLTQGFNVAENIIRKVNGRPLKLYNPIGDLGYVFPMANNRSCGYVLGVSMKGVLPSWLHYFMCIARSYGWTNRWGILKNLLRKSPS